MSEFRFSPRPNRAGEIAWMAWGPQAFARAEAEDKPILLAISAVWCHWCHVMDETSYSDEGVIERINRRYVPVRVDNDRRPDINARYNMGGWPTTAFLTPDGTTLTGATYLPPPQLRRALDEIADFYSEHKSEIGEQRDASQRVPQPRPGPEPAELGDMPVASLVEQFESLYDPEYGGFGNEPKFPQPDGLEFLLAQWRATGEQRLYAMVAQSVRGMSRGGMYDHVEGGFFRYSTTRDWSVPHFEKMAEDHAGLIRVLAALAIFAPTDDAHTALVSTVAYVRNVLYDERTQLFRGSQDADETYYELPLEERRKLATPYVDPTSYTNWTCALAGALALAARALDDDDLLALALRSLDAVHQHLLDPDGLLYHVAIPEHAPEVRGLLTDQVAYARALLDAHEISGEPRFLERAQTLADRTIAAFGAQEGGFYDRLPSSESYGRLALTDRSIVENGSFADSLLRLAALTGDPKYRECAERVLRLYYLTAASAGIFASSYARALARFRAPELSVRIVGTPASTDEFREAALRLPPAFLTIRTLAARDAAQFDLPASPEQTAYVCTSTACGAPASDAGSLRASYEALVA